jgi:hypothetical protein
MIGILGKRRFISTEMARPVSKYKIKLSGKEKQELRQTKKQGRKNARLVIRILIILLADAGKTIAQTAVVLDCCEQTVLNQRQRFVQRRGEGSVVALQDLPRSGRPVIYGAKAQAQVVATVCQTLHERKLPLSRMSLADLHQVIIHEENLVHLSQSSLSRILHQHALKPWRYQYWLFPRDPDFVAKACVVLDLYAGFWEGQRLGPEEYLLSADEKTIQVLARCHPSTLSSPGHLARVEFEYERLGTVAYHAAWDVFRARIFGLVVPTTCIVTFNQLIDQVMTQTPYQNSARTFWLVDGGRAHHPHTFPARLQAMYPNTVAVSLPVHASWLNQIEIYFSILQRKVLTPMEVTNQEMLTTRVLDFQDYYQERAKPFTWKFTAEDLKKRLETLHNFMAI